MVLSHTNTNSSHYCVPVQSTVASLVIGSSRDGHSDRFTKSTGRDTKERAMRAYRRNYLRLLRSTTARLSGSQLAIIKALGLRRYRGSTGGRRSTRKPITVVASQRERYKSTSINHVTAALLGLDRSAVSGEIFRPLIKQPEVVCIRESMLLTQPV